MIMASRQLKLECLKQAVIVTNTVSAASRPAETLRVARLMFDWVREIRDDDGHERADD